LYNVCINITCKFSFRPIQFNLSEHIFCWIGPAGCSKKYARVKIFGRTAALIKKIPLGLLAVMLLFVLGFAVWGSTPLGPMPEAAAALQSDSQVQVETGKWVTFRPVGQAPETALIYYPGGRVDYRSYAPYARKIAAAGYLVVITPMPLSLAVMAPGRAEDVIQAFPEIKNWAIGGHSLGGAMAANYAYQHPQQVRGLVLLAAYPAEANNLAQSGVKVISIYGTLDGLATGGKIDASKALLPVDTQFVAIEGGNHGQFGWYGPQSGDNSASISREQQEDEVVAAVIPFLQGLSKQQ
jgi:dienelactone hydrolase